MRKIFFKNSGVASLPTIMALTILILAVGIGVTSLAFSESLISAGATQSSKALVYAEAGARDALERIARKKTYTCNTPAQPTSTSGCYNIDFAGGTGCSPNNDGCAYVTVSSGTGNPSPLDPKVILSWGVVKSNIRKIQVNVELDASLNGKITTTTWSELTN